MKYHLQPSRIQVYHIPRKLTGRTFFPRKEVQFKVETELAEILVILEKHNMLSFLFLMCTICCDIKFAWSVGVRPETRIRGRERVRSGRARALKSLLTDPKEGEDDRGYAQAEIDQSR